MTTPKRSIRVDDETWLRWSAAVHDAEVDVDSVSELVHRAVDSYLAPKLELQRLRARVESLEGRLFEARVALEDDRAG